MTALILSRYIINFLDGLTYCLLIAVLIPIKRDFGKIVLFSAITSLLYGTDFYLVYVVFREAEFVLPILSTILVSIVVVSVASMLFNLGYKKSIIIFFLFQLATILSAFCAKIVLYFFSISIDMENVFTFILGNALNLLTICVIFIVIWLVKPVVRFSEDIRNKYFMFFFVNLLFLLTTLSAVLRIYEKSELIYGMKDSIFMGSFFALTVIYSLFMLFFTLRVLKTDNFEEELGLQKFYNQTLETLTGDLRRFKHNYDNSLAVIYGYANRGEVAELTRYIEEITHQQVNNHMGMLSLMNIKSTGLSTILSTKLTKASESGVEVSVYISDQINEIKMRVSDLCEIVGILMDNAIEAAAESAEKRIRLELGSVNGEVRLNIINHIPASVNIQHVKEKGWSTKGEERGLGLWIVDNLIRKYSNAVLNSSVYEGLFMQELIITNHESSLLKNNF
ncbi:GHKL domain-containing protein [Paenibacillus sp. MMS20-IR301]|uniref:sensor histidine kinase n=1 Tax=Paenibacillus sp. MMS20-IR301 TaxID=2895946 RepID=UPI0028E2018F|nr:GHKL domain-containing protein [Paenibacillus sp. MMS20-IR301]WNS42895.1 GHKL domain-containing protein [Paenibacillus sp. MMS20-IR301]